MVKEQIRHDREQTFWDVVARCLVEFYRYSDEEAFKSVEDYRWKIAKLPRRQHSLIFHNEPINLAADLSGKSLKLDDHSRAMYAQILRDAGAAEHDS